MMLKHVYSADCYKQRLIIIIFKPTSTKPQAGKLDLTYRIMIATAIYSVTMVLWKETAFPLCRTMERRWKKKLSPGCLL